MADGRYSRFEPALAALVIFYFGALYYLRIGDRASEIDFGSYYVWAYAARHGINPYLAANVKSLAIRLGVDALTANYPPLFILMVEPLSLLPPQRAFWLWSGINLMFLLISVTMLVSGLEGRQKRVFFGAAALLYGPVTDALFWGQAEIVVLLLLSVALLGLRNRRDCLCGIAVGLAALWKVYPILVLGYFVLCRRKAVVVYAGLTVLAGIAVSAGAFITEINVGFMNELWRTGGDKYWPYTLDVSLGAVISRFLLLLAGGNPDSTVKMITVATIALSEALAAALTIYATLIARRRGEEILAFGLWVATAVVLTPIIWVHHLTILLIPLVQIASAARSGELAFRLGIYSYCFSQLGLLSYWIGWRLWPAYETPIQLVTAYAAFAAILLAFGAAVLLCIRGCSLARHPTPF